jgi:hypothetical protein
MICKRIQRTGLFFVLLSIGVPPAWSGGGRADSDLSETAALLATGDGAHGVTRPAARENENDRLDQELMARLQLFGFTGSLEATLERRLGRPVNPTRANLGRLLWFDTITGLNNDNTCAGWL